jgi:hypothetical protein
MAPTYLFHGKQIMDKVLEGMPGGPSSECSLVPIKLLERCCSSLVDRDLEGSSGNGVAFGGRGLEQGSGRQNGCQGAPTSGSDLNVVPTATDDDDFNNNPHFGTVAS